MLKSIVTPFQILEEIAGKYLDADLTLDGALTAIEGQFERVNQWLDKLRELPVPEFETGAEMYQLGETANTLMLESMELLHGSLENDDLEGMETALESLEESHHLLLRSLQISQQIQTKAEDDDEREICFAIL